MILFDFDGTLVNSNHIWHEVDVEFLAEHNLAPTDEYLELVGKSIFPVAAQITKDYYHLDLELQEIMDTWLALAYEAYAHHIPMKDGAMAFLEQCAMKGQPMALVTACEPSLCQVAMERLNLTQFFSQVIYVQDLGVEKGHPSAFPLILEKLGVSGGACTLYDDSPSACKAALAHGITTIAMYDPCYAHAKGELTTLCHGYLHSFRELL